MHNTYTYRGTVNQNGRKLDRIDVAIQIGFDKTNNAMGLDVAVSEQQNHGTMYFDAAAGRFVETQLAQKMTLETAIGDRTHRQRLDTTLRMRFAAAKATRTGPRTARQRQSVGRRPAKTNVSPTVR